MNNHQKWVAIAIIIVLVVSAFVSAFVAAGQRDDLKQEAVDRGFAEWVIKGQNKTEFKWKEK
jgi:hypothetical protein